MIRGFTHAAHLNEIYVSDKQVVKAGSQIGTLGSTGSSTSAHCHFESWKVDPRTLGSGWQNRYTTGLTMAQVEARYYNPLDYLKDKVYPVLGGYRGSGYVYGQVNADGQIHPGDDINAGSGNSDIGTPVLACEDSEVIGVFDTSTGFGKHVFLRALSEQESNLLNEEDMTKEQTQEMIDESLRNYVLPKPDLLFYKDPVSKRVTLYEDIGTGKMQIKGKRMLLWLISKFFNLHEVKSKPDSVVKKYSL